MSSLTIKVLSQNDEPLAETLEAEFDDQGGTIGRGAGSTLLLPDPLRQISRTHAVIDCSDGRYRLTNRGSATAVVVNSHTLANGQSARIQPGDEIVIGGYRMQVMGEAIGDLPTVLAQAPNEADISMVGTVLSWSEGGTDVPVNRIQTVIVPSPHEAGAPPAPAPAVEPEPPPPVHTRADDKTLPVSTPAPVIADTPRESASPAQPSTSLQADSSATPDALLQAFLEGAGVPRLRLAGGLTPELMQSIGEMLRETVRGLLDLLHARALTKREVRADATVIVAQDNNPLKFSPTLEAAMSHLLVPRQGMGFMAPLRAVSDAHQSLRSHQLAFMAGMQAGLASVLRRIDPHALAQRSGQPSLMGAMVPTTHKARLWEQYCELHASIARDADADFQSLFGREFLKAYHSQVTQMREQQGAVRE